MHQPAVDLLPRPVMAALKAMKDEFKPQPATWSLACNKRTIKLEIVWEKLSPAERTSPRQQDRGRQKTNRNHDRTGDYSKLKELARKHGRTRRAADLDVQTTYTKYHSDLFTKREKPELSTKDSNMMDQAPSPWVTLPVKVEKDDSSPTDNTNISEPVNFWQEVKTKKKRNRGSKGRSNSVATQTVARETKSKDTHGGFAAIMETLLQVEDPKKPLLDAEGSRVKEEKPRNDEDTKNDRLCSLL